MSSSSSSFEVGGGVDDDEEELDNTIASSSFASRSRSGLSVLKKECRSEHTFFSGGGGGGGDSLPRGDVDARMQVGVDAASQSQARRRKRAVQYATRYAAMPLWRKACCHAPKKQRYECLRGMGAIIAGTAALVTLAEWLQQEVHNSSWSVPLLVLRASTSVLGACIVLIWWVDPGYLRPHAPHPRAAEWAAAGAERCPQCDVQRPPKTSDLSSGQNWRTHHCRICKVCVLDFDHHCSVLGRCISKRNVALFVGVNFAGAIAALSWSMLMRDIAYDYAARSWPADSSSSSPTWLAWMFFHLVMDPVCFAAAGFSMFLGIFGVVHVFPLDDVIDNARDEIDEQDDDDDAGGGGSDSHGIRSVFEVCVRLCSLTVRVLTALGQLVVTRHAYLRDSVFGRRVPHRRKIE